MCLVLHPGTGHQYGRLLLVEVNWSRMYQLIDMSEMWTYNADTRG